MRQDCPSAARSCVLSHTSTGVNRRINPTITSAIPTQNRITTSKGYFAWADRKKAKQPMTFWHDRDSLLAHLQGDKAEPFFCENLDQPPPGLTPNALGWPIQEAYPLPGGRRAIQTTVLMGSKAVGKGPISLQKIEENKETILAATRSLRVLQLVLVCDETGSMAKMFRRVQQGRASAVRGRDHC